MPAVVTSYGTALVLGIVLGVTMRLWKVVPTVALSALLFACGGGGGPTDMGTPSTAGTSTNPNGSVAVPQADGSSVVIPTVTILAEGPDQAVGSGTQAKLSLTIRNTGLTTAEQVHVSTALGDGLTFESGTCTSQAGAVCPASIGPMSVVPVLPPGVDVKLELNIAVRAGVRGAIESTASLSLGTSAGSAALGSARVVVNAITADLAASLTSAPIPTTTGGLASHTFEVRNLGPDIAQGVTVTTTPDVQQSLVSVSCSPSGGAVCPASVSGQFNIATLPVGGRLILSAQTRVITSQVDSALTVFTVRGPGDNVVANDSVTSTVRLYRPNKVILNSDYGDYIGGGKNYSYTRANSSLRVNASQGHVSVDVTGDENWFGGFTLPGSYSEIRPGLYSGLTRDPFRNASVGGLEWGGEGRGCNTISGSVTVSRAVYDGADLKELDYSFEQHCEGGASALRGVVHWTVYDSSEPPGPVSPIPSGLWSPSAGKVPGSGNYVYLQSDFGDYVGAGREYLYTQATSIFTVGAPGAQFNIYVNGFQSWNGNFASMIGQSSLQVGYYSDLKRYPFHNPVKGGLDWSGDGRGCNTETGWFAVDNVSYVDGKMSAIDLRFEQHCEGGVAALHGKIHWSANDPTSAPGPQSIPSGLWMPPSSVLPSSGNYFYISSDAGDYIGSGQTKLYSIQNSSLNLNSSGGVLMMNVSDLQDSWSSEFSVMNGLTQIKPGYYANLTRYPFQNPVVGGFSWSGNGRGCNTLTAWVSVDSRPCKTPGTRMNTGQAG